MRPELVALFARHGLPGFLVPDYLTLVGLSSLLCAIYVLRRTPPAVRHVHARALALAYVVAIPGGYAFEAVRMLPSAIATRDVEPMLRAGRAAYGGLFASVSAALLYLRRHREPVAPFLENIAVPAGVIFCAVRVGCFLAGCDYGVVTSSPLGVRFPAESLAALDHASRGFVPAGAPSLPVHPTELYEAAIALAAAVVASRMKHRFATWLGTYATGRFFVETLRGDVERGVYGGLSSAQWVSLVIVAGLWFAFRARRVAVAAAAVVCLALLAPDASANQDHGPTPAPTYPYPYYAPPPPYIPPPKAAPEPRPERLVDLRVVVAPSLVMARRDVPSGAAFEAQGLYRVPTSANTRFGVGGELRAVGNAVAAHYALGVPFQFVIQAGRRFDLHFTFALAHTWIKFRSPFFASTSAWGTRWEFGFNILLGNTAFLGFSPICFNVLSAEDIGVVTTYEPRMWFGLSF